MLTDSRFWIGAGVGFGAFYLLSMRNAKKARG